MSNQITPNPSVPSQVVQEVKFPKFVNNLGIIPTSYKDSMSYYECLAWLCKFLEETVIPTVNENGEAVEELQRLYVELNSYVSNYLTDENLQPLVNKKLDEMAESGYIESLISKYIDDSMLQVFNTIDDLLSAQLIANQKVKTLGYNAINDNGGAYYYITDNEPSSYYETLNNGLYAILIVNKEINVKQLGAKGDGTADDTTAFQNAIDNFNCIFIPEGTYKISTLSISKEKFIMYGEGDNSVLIKIDDTNNNLITVSGTSTYIDLHDFMIQGNFESSNTNNGLYFSDRDEWAGRHNIRNLRIFYFNGYGLYLGAKTQGSKITNLRIHYTKNDGMCLKGADNIVDHCIISKSKTFGANIISSDSTISNLRINECNENESDSCAGLYISGDCIYSAIMLQQNYIHDIIVNDSNNIIDYISNMLSATNGTASSCVINGNYNIIKSDIYNGKAGKYFDYIIKFGNNVVGNDIKLNSSSVSYANKGLFNLYAKAHHSNIVYSQGNNYNNFVNKFDTSTMETLNSQSPVVQSISPNELGEFTYQTGLTSLTTGQRIMFNIPIAGEIDLTGASKINLSFDYDSNIPESNVYVYEAYIMDSSFQSHRPENVNTVHHKGTMNAIFDISNIAWTPNVIRLAIRKAVNDEIAYTNMTFKVSNVKVTLL